MKKFHFLNTLIVALAVLFGFSPSYAASTVFYENCPQGPQDANAANIDSPDKWYAVNSASMGIIVLGTQDVNRRFNVNTQDGTVFASPALDIAGPGTVHFSFKAGTDGSDDNTPHFKVFIGTDRENLDRQMDGTLKPALAAYYQNVGYAEESVVTADVAEAGTYYVGIKFEAGCNSDYTFIVKDLSWMGEGDTPGTGGVIKKTFFENEPGYYSQMEWTRNSLVTYYKYDKARYNYMTGAGGMLISPELEVPGPGEISFSACFGRSGGNAETVAPFEIYLSKNTENPTEMMDGEIVFDNSATGSTPCNLTATVGGAGKYYVIIKFTDAVQTTAKYTMCQATCKYEGREADPTTLTLNKETLALEVGQEETLEATVAPDAEAKVTWTSSDEAVATVDENGKVVAVAAGEATIKATCNEAEATCVVTVTEAAVVYTIALDKATAEVEEAKTIELVATLTPAKEDAVYTWTSSDEEVATVADGVVTGVKAGTATIKVEAEGVEATCEVTVLPKAGIEALFVDGAQYDVYTADGVLVLRGADFEAFRALGAGLYVVNGRKVLVK